ICCLLIAIIAAGCSGGSSAGRAGSVGAAKGPIKGSLHGGQSPICNSTVTLFGAGLQSSCGTAITDSTGQVNIVPGVCGAVSTTQMYIVANGGVPNTNNCSTSSSALSLSAALGQFDNLPSFVTINEATTVASVWALNQFLSSNGQNLFSGGL